MASNERPCDGDRLRSLELAISVGYAVSLPLSLTLSWALLIAGLVVWAGQVLYRSLRSAPDTKETGESGGEKAGLASDIPAALVQRGNFAPLLLPLALLAAAVTISGAFNGGSVPGVLCSGGLSESLACLFSLRALLTYFWACHLFSDNRGAAFTCLKALLVTGALAGIMGTIEQIFDFHPFGGYKYLQGTGFLGSPMPFAGQMQILSLLCLSLLFFGSYRSFKPWLSRFDLFFCLTMANLAGVVFAGERSAWLGAAAGAVVLSALKSGKTLAKCLLALSIISALGWFCVPLVHTRIESLLSGQADVSTRVRLTLWRESIKCFASSPYVGVGFRKFPHFDIPEAIVPGRSRDLNHAHSNYLQLLATSGGLGLAAYLILWLAALAYAFGLFRRSLSTLDAEATGLAAGVLSGVVALMVAGIFEYNFGTAQVRLLQWFVLGMLSIPVLRADVPPEQAP